MNSLRLIVPVLAAALGCIEAFVDVPIGPVNVTIALPVQAVPAALLDTNGALRRLACSAAAPCPQAATAEVTVRCTDAVCVLAPFTVRALTTDIDLTSYSAYRDYANSLQDVTIRAASIQITGASVGNSAGPLEVWWTGESTAADVPERRLGVTSQVTLTPGATDVPVTVDAAGVRELGARIMAGHTRFRVRLEGPLDVGAGALPAAQVHFAITFLVHLHGSL